MTVLRPTRLLLIEDDRDVRESMVDLLADVGFHVVSAVEGQQALDELRKGFHPHLILLDLMMGGMDGYQFLTEVRKDPQHAEVPILVLTAQSPNSATAADLGVAALVRKPFEFDDLLVDIRRLLDAPKAAISN